MSKKASERTNATIRDVAERAGVSISTVSRVINGRVAVLPEKKTRVLEAIAALDFEPRAAARVLAGSKTMTLGLLVPEISGDFFSSMLRGIEKAARASGYQLLIQTTDDKPCPRPRRSLADGSTDGLLLFAHSVDDDLVRDYAAEGHPLVLLYRTSPAGLDLPCVTIENAQGAAAAIEHLIDVHGRRRIVCLTGPENNHDASARERGYRAALDARGIALDRELLAPGDYSMERGEASIRALLSAGVAFDAVFAGDDAAAIGALKALREEGRRVPEDVSLVGFDDQSFAAHTSPSLATVRAPTEEVGAEAVRLLLLLISGRSDLDSVVLKTRLVPRESCGCGRARP